MLVTLYLNDHLAFGGAPAGANTTLDFAPVSNSSYFNQSFNNFDRLDGSGRSSLLQSAMTYFVPNGAALNYRMQLQAGASTSFGFDFTNNVPLANGATADASNTGFLNFKVITPGGYFTSQSGADYITLQDAVGGVPEPASWALMIAGFGVAGAAQRRRRAPIAS